MKGVVTKGQLRTKLLHQLKQQKEEERRRKSKAIWRRLRRLAVFRRAKTVLCYVSLPYEVQTWQLIEQMLNTKKRVVVPRVRKRALVLSELLDAKTDLAPGAFGVWEPRAQALRPVQAKELDLAVVPGLAFDRRGRRLGHGHGYFDRLLAHLPDTTATVGVCFDFQLFDCLPTEPHDKTVGVVLSA